MKSWLVPLIAFQCTNGKCVYETCMRHYLIMQTKFAEQNIVINNIDNHPAALLLCLKFIFLQGGGTCI